MSKSAFAKRDMKWAVEREKLPSGIENECCRGGIQQTPFCLQFHGFISKSMSNWNDVGQDASEVEVEMLLFFNA